MSGCNKTKMGWIWGRGEFQADGTELHGKCPVVGRMQGIQELGGGIRWQEGRGRWAEPDCRGLGRTVRVWARLLAHELHRVGIMSVFFILEYSALSTLPGTEREMVND